MRLHAFHFDVIDQQDRLITHISKMTLEEANDLYEHLCEDHVPFVAMICDGAVLAFARNDYLYTLH
jgi:hypothetical protein